MTTSSDAAPPRFKGPICRGSYALGTACGKCERCNSDPRNPKNQPASAAPPSDRAKVVAWMILNRDGNLESPHFHASKARAESWASRWVIPSKFPCNFVPLVPESALVAALAEVERLTGDNTLLRGQLQGWRDTLAAERSRRETAERDAHAWKDLVFEIGDMLGCLASSFNDSNGHILKAVDALLVKLRAPSEQSDPTPEHET